MAKLFKRRSALLFFLIPNLFKLVLVMITMTCRVRWHNKEALEAATESDSGWIISMWHDNVSIAAWAMRNRHITAMVSDSRDGEYITRCANKFGNEAVRGSSSKGSSKAMRAMLKLLKQSKPVAITPDGPRGPRYKMQGGALWFAALGQVPIIPLHIEATRQWVFRSWDKHKMPKPFSTIHVGIGTPTMIDREQLDRDPDAVTEMIEAVMMENTNAIKQAAGVST